MKISVVMIDGGFRENTFGAEYFSKQAFPEDEYEVIWVEYYRKVPEHVRQQSKVKVITLNYSEDTVYHSSYCFNKGIADAKGELIVIPDADQIVKPDFLSQLWELHAAYDKLVVYPYRYDEVKEGELKSFEFEELDRKCILKNPKNYGGCLSVRKKWLEKINGYEQHPIFETGFHANGLDVYTRFKNLGLAIMWAPQIKMYHPWHAFTLAAADQYKIQLDFIDWRFNAMQYQAIKGIIPENNYTGFDEKAFMEGHHKKQLAKLIKQKSRPGLIKRILKKFE